jgi:hypothetical protein
MTMKLIVSVMCFTSSLAWAALPASPDVRPGFRQPCPTAKSTLKHHHPRELDELTPYLASQSIRLVTAHADPHYIEQFIHEYEKFPLTLRRELVGAGARINLIQGGGVTDDPSWNRGDNLTFDGRGWSNVPGSGGFPYTRPAVPTRIVINHLYEHHGSTNLVLHEHGHSLDSIYNHNTVSNSKTWKKLIASEQTMSFLGKICGNYCTENRNEGFAESFAYYHACDASRTQMEREAPELAEFFKNFQSVRGMQQEERRQEQEARQLEQDRRNEELRREQERRNEERRIENERRNPPMSDEERQAQEERRAETRRRLELLMGQTQNEKPAEKPKEEPKPEVKPESSPEVKPERPTQSPAVEEGNDDLRSALARLAEERRRKEEARKRDDKQ